MVRVQVSKLFWRKFVAAFTATLIFVKHFKHRLEMRPKATPLALPAAQRKMKKEQICIGLKSSNKKVSRSMQ